MKNNIVENISNGKLTKEKFFKSNLFLVLLFVIFGSLPWYGITPLSQFVMFVPLLMLQERSGGVKFMNWSVVALILWNFSSLWWIGNATILGPLAAAFATTTLMSIVLNLYNRVWLNATRPLAYTVLVAGWVAAEWFYAKNLEISFPWINLGNGFGITPSFVQWYEYTGALGGTLWVMVVNIIIFEGLKECKKYDFKNILASKKLLFALIFIVAPIIYSLVVYHTYKIDYKGSKAINVAVLQPNIDPYGEKFGSLSQNEQLNILLELAREAKGSNVDFFIAPETALDNDFWVHTVQSSLPVEKIESFLRENQPKADFITGLVIRQYYSKKEFDSAPTFTSRTTPNLPFYYDSYNSAISISDGEKIELYHKSRLAIGVEMMPFYRYTRNLGDFFVDLGGQFGMYATQDERTLLTNETTGVKVGCAICFESVYGEFITQFINKGAEALFIITNDGWWKDTPGYRQHLSFASLRAIETRREIARSANTGISAIIDSRGDILEHTLWDERTLLEATIKTNDKITVYVKYGDYIGRLSAYIFVLSLLYAVSYYYKRRNHLV
ncbi:MAG: apolipoprotein N-acyltransferase [Rikenellaceae bacterium]